LFQLVIILAEELEVLVGDVDVAVSAESAVFLDGGPSPRERESVDLLLDLCGGVGEEDGGVFVRGGHLRLRALQRREERRVHQRWLDVAQPRRHVPRHTEIRVLQGRREGQRLQRTLRGSNKGFEREKTDFGG
jgi:hypothetical protein